MTPKEKAEELVNKFKIGDVVTEKLQVVNINIYSKLSALIAVDEIIEFMEVDDFDSDTCYWANHSKMQYWQEVKQEIENL